jgi:hypothetical protein
MRFDPEPETLTDQSKNKTAGFQEEFIARIGKRNTHGYPLVMLNIM